MAKASLIIIYASKAFEAPYAEGIKSIPSELVSHMAVWRKPSTPHDARGFLNSETSATSVDHSAVEWLLAPRNQTTLYMIAICRGIGRPQVPCLRAIDQHLRQLQERAVRYQKSRTSHAPHRRPEEPSAIDRMGTNLDMAGNRFLASVAISVYMLVYIHWTISAAKTNSCNPSSIIIRRAYGVNKDQNTADLLTLRTTFDLRR